jgi:multisubunit Na+/H+ antiporter MnhB subunit
MSKKIKKSTSDTAESLSFSLSRWYRRVSSTQPSAFIVIAIVIGYSIFLFSGGLFTIINRPLPSAYFNNKFYFLYPSIDNQFISDTVISVILYALGFMGLISIYQSSKSAYKPRQAYMLLVIGVALLLLSYIFLEGSIQFKINQGQ